MQYTFTEKELLAKLREAHQAGYEPLIIINGEYYEIQWDNTKGEGDNE